MEDKKELDSYLAFSLLAFADSLRIEFEKRHGTLATELLDEELAKIKRVK